MESAERRRHYLALRIFLGIAALTFLAYGIGALFSNELPISFALVFADNTLRSTPEVVYLGKTLGVFVTANGILIAIAMLHPMQHRLIVWWSGCLLIARAIQRLLSAATVAELFGISYARNAVSAGYLVFLGICIFYLAPRKPEEHHSSEKA